MTKAEFKEAYRVAREYGPCGLPADHPVRVAEVGNRCSVDYLAYRSVCAAFRGDDYRPLSVPLKLYKARKRWHRESGGAGTCRPAVRSVPRPGFLELVGHELTIADRLQWRFIETALGDNGELWIFGGEQ